MQLRPSRHWTLFETNSRNCWHETILDNGPIVWSVLFQSCKVRMEVQRNWHWLLLKSLSCYRAQLAVPEDLECEKGPHAAVWKQAMVGRVVRTAGLVVEWQMKVIVARSWLDFYQVWFFRCFLVCLCLFGDVRTRNAFDHGLDTGVRVSSHGVVLCAPGPMFPRWRRASGHCWKTHLGRCTWAYWGFSKDDKTRGTFLTWFLPDWVRNHFLEIFCCFIFKSILRPSNFSFVTTHLALWVWHLAVKSCSFQ